MIKERRFSPKFDFHTGSVTKISFVISIVLLIVVAIELLLNITLLLDSSIFLALAILFLGVTGISWFFYSQFAKLSKIVTELENDESEQD